MPAHTRGGINGAPPIATVGGYPLTWDTKLAYSSLVLSADDLAFTWDFGGAAGLELTQPPASMTLAALAASAEAAQGVAPLTLSSPAQAALAAGASGQIALAAQALAAELAQQPPASLSLSSPASAALHAQALATLTLQALAAAAASGSASALLTLSAIASAQEIARQNAAQVLLEALSTLGGQGMEQPPATVTLAALATAARAAGAPAPLTLSAQASAEERAQAVAALTLAALALAGPQATAAAALVIGAGQSQAALHALSPPASLTLAALSRIDVGAIAAELLHWHEPLAVLLSWTEELASGAGDVRALSVGSAP